MVGPERAKLKYLTDARCSSVHMNEEKARGFGEIITKDYECGVFKQGHGIWNINTVCQGRQ